MSSDCLYPFGHLYIEPRGTVSVCCAFHHQNSQYLIQTPEDLDDWASHPELSNIRNHFRNERSMIEDGCGQCIYHERNKEIDFNPLEKYISSSLSMRETFNEKFTKEEMVDLYVNPKIRSMHIKFGNLCNLACRTCSEESSSLLQKEFGIIYTTQKKVIPIERFGDLQWYEKPGVFEKLLTYAKDLKELHASGGEPLVNEYFWNFAKYCFEKGYSKNIRLGINTNGTVTLKPNQIEILRGFYSVSFDVSQDAFGELSEYIRTRSVWTNFKKNIEQYKELTKEPLESKEHIRVRMVITISVYNVHKIDELLKYAKDNDYEWFYQFVHFPKELNIANLNEDAKEYIRKKYSNTNCQFIVDYLNNESPVTLNESTKSYIDRRDEKAKTLYKNFKMFREIESEWYNKL